MLFEISKCDLAGRIGTLETNHGKVQTPAFVPVIHPCQNNPYPRFKAERNGICYIHLAIFYKPGTPESVITEPSVFY